MTDTGLGLYPVHDPEMPELVEALQAHIERLGHTYATNENLDPHEGAQRIGHATDIYHRMCEALAELRRFGRVPAYSDETRRAMLLKQVADWERLQKGGR
jgi:hypothetical protein